MFPKQSSPLEVDFKASEWTSLRTRDEIKLLFVKARLLVFVKARLLLFVKARLLLFVKARLLDIHIVRFSQLYLQATELSK